MKKKFFLFFFFMLTGLSSVLATHNRAGEITYTCLGGFTYKITVTTYSNTNGTQVDQCELTVDFGDGDNGTAPRVNGNSTPDCPHNGVMISTYTKLNIYEIVHTYPGAGATYTITMEDPNRNLGICNIPSSVNQSFFLRTELVINPFLGVNNSPILLNPPIDNACVGECFVHNPGAYDAEGDSLSYSLVPCYANGQPIFGYSLPPVTPGGSISIDPVKGDLVWCRPPSICQYNVAILIKEYKLEPLTKKRYFVGSILRDMQIDVGTCSNTAPHITDISDTCIVAGSNLNFKVTATDPEANLLTLTATGGPFQLSPAATFSSSPSISTVNGTFNWTPDCTEPQLLPYLVTFKVTDNASDPLVDFKSVFIKVVAPAPASLTATPNGASMLLSWNSALCNATTGKNRLTGYLIYRKNTCDPWVHSPCETGVPGYTGYSLIGSTKPLITTFSDNNNGQGLIHGVSYSYIVVATYSDGSQSYASTNVCKELVRDIPIITNVDVIVTDAITGSIRTNWVKPIATVNNLDTIANPPPYEYRLMQAQGFNPSSAKFSAVSSFVYSAYWQLTDAGFLSTGLNTKDLAYTYRVDFYSNGLLKGSTHTASSVYLSSSPTDNKVNLSWQEFVPWTNYKYYIYKETAPGSAVFVKLDSTVTKTYVDTGLVNGTTYCYKIVSVGEYSDVTLPRPLFNSSEIKCETPVDQIPPCQPAFTVSDDCDLMQNKLSWTNPNTYCSDDAVKYNIYFARTKEEALTLIYSSTDLNTTTYTHTDDYDGVPSIAGCYAVTAVDSVGNESVITTKLCVDNCPIYELPNVFTPNGDSQNDLFTPLLPYRFVKDIDLKIYDRWGLLMFQTTDPYIMWDGKNADSKKLCTNGTYYYVCTVNEIRVDGVQPRILKGFIQLIQDKTGPSR